MNVDAEEPRPFRKTRVNGDGFLEIREKEDVLIPSILAANLNLPVSPEEGSLDQIWTHCPIDEYREQIDRPQLKKLHEESSEKCVA